MSLKQFILTVIACVTLSQVGPRAARAQAAYELSLEDERGYPLQTFAHRGQLFAMGRMGQKYNVRVTNRSPRRVEAVVTVDGRDVMSGEPGDFKSQRGYLISAYDSVLIEGFRTSLREVAAFRFTDPSDSYSARRGSPENVGVIGVAFFPEAMARIPRPVRPTYPLPAPRRGYPGKPSLNSYEGESRQGRAPASAGKAAEAPAAPMAPAAQQDGSQAYRDSDEESASNIGTQYGEQQQSEVVEVSFRRARPHRPDRVVAMRYDDRRGLEARGIRTQPRPEPRAARWPSAFPGNRFAPPPPY